MEEHQEVQETPENETPQVKKHDGLKGLSEEQYISIIEELRQEAGNHRKGKQEIKSKLEEDAKKWQEHLNSKKSEAEKLAESNAALLKKLEDMERDKLRRAIADEFSLDPDLVEFIDGSDEAEMRKRAEKLAAKAVTPKNPLDLRPGNRGEPVVPKRSKGGDFLMDLGRNVHH